jgi:predicted nuclease of predicted toxin-antitoxin system
VKILADPFFPEAVVNSLVEAGHDALHAGDIGAGDLPLREFLRLAAFEERIVVTRNRSVARLVESDRSPWPSVIFFRQDSMDDERMATTLFSLLDLFDEDLRDGALVIVREGQTLLRKLRN